MRQHLGVRGYTPAGVQRAEPFGARRRGAGAGQRPAAPRVGVPAAEARESRGQRPLEGKFEKVLSFFGKNVIMDNGQKNMRKEITFNYDCRY